jgi:hypothetical protein
VLYAGHLILVFPAGESGSAIGTPIRAALRKRVAVALGPAPISRGDAPAVIGRLPHARFRGLLAAGYGHFACGFSVVFVADCFLATRVI